MTAVGAMPGIPSALVLRLVIIAATLCLTRYPRLSRWTALGGSIVASAITTAVAIRVIVSSPVIEAARPRLSFRITDLRLSRPANSPGSNVTWLECHLA